MSDAFVRAIRDAIVSGEQAGQRFQLTVPRRLPTGSVGGQQGARAGNSLGFFVNLLTPTDFSSGQGLA